MNRKVVKHVNSISSTNLRSSCATFSEKQPRRHESGRTWWPQTARQWKRTLQHLNLLPVSMPHARRLSHQLQWRTRISTRTIISSSICEKMANTTNLNGFMDGSNTTRLMRRKTESCGACVVQISAPVLVRHFAGDGGGAPITSCTRL